MAEPKVLIVGGGPTGLLASILLSNHEIPHVLVERRRSTVDAPAAHVINTRTMEIYRQAGLDVDALYALNRHRAAHLVSWKGRLHHEPIGVFDMAADHEGMLAQQNLSGERTTNISQHLLEQHLKAHAERSRFADIRFGTNWLDFASADHSSSRCLGDDGNEFVVRYDYLLAADGAASPVAQKLGISKIGPDAIATLLNLTCEVDVAQAAGDSKTLLYWLLDPKTPGTIVVHEPHGLAVYMRPLAVPFESAEDYDDERCEVLLREVFGGLACKVRHKGVWKMTAQVAERFREGPVFLVGDAAHRFPPTGGLGLNTGVGDVHNLVWKLAACLKHELAQREALLDSFELERKPVAQRNSDVSARNNNKMIEVVRSVGLDPAKAPWLARIMNSVGVKHLPKRMQELVFAGLSYPARRALRQAQNSGRKGERVRQRVALAIANQREHFSSTGLDLGYVYRVGCAVADTAGATPGSEVSSYRECVGAGARLPHRRLRDGSRLHDQIDYTAFTLVAGPDCKHWPAETFGLPVNVLKLAGDELGLGRVGWALVRPDGHVLDADRR